MSNESIVVLHNVGDMTHYFRELKKIMKQLKHLNVPKQDKQSETR